MDANPFSVTIHEDADGGPEHILWLLRSYVFSFRKRGANVVVGKIENVVNNKITVVKWNDMTQEYDGDQVVMSVFGDEFDEVMYL